MEDEDVTLDVVEPPEQAPPPTDVPEMLPADMASGQPARPSVCS